MDLLQFVKEFLVCLRNVFVSYFIPSSCCLVKLSHDVLVFGESLLAAWSTHSAVWPWFAWHGACHLRLPSSDGLCPLDFVKSRSVLQMILIVFHCACKALVVESVGGPHRLDRGLRCQAFGFTTTSFWERAHASLRRSEFRIPALLHKLSGWASALSVRLLFDWVELRVRNCLGEKCVPKLILDEGRLLRLIHFTL